MKNPPNPAPTMEDKSNLRIYKAWAPVYDLVMRPFYGKARRQTLSMLDLQPGESVLIPGVGTGLDLPLLPAGVRVTGIDLSPAMLEKACSKCRDLKVSLAVMNAQKLEFEAGRFDAVILNLILSVVPDGAAAFGEAWRVLRPGGRLVIFDKFLPEDGNVTPMRRFIARFLRCIGTDPNRRLSDILRGARGLEMERNLPSLLHGQYRIILLRKMEGAS